MSGERLKELSGNESKDAKDDILREEYATLNKNNYAWIIRFTTTRFFNTMELVIKLLFRIL